MEAESPTLIQWFNDVKALSRAFLHSFDFFSPLLVARWLPSPKHHIMHNNTYIKAGREWCVHFMHLRSHQNGKCFPKFSN